MITYTGREVYPRNSTQEGVAKDVGPSMEDIAVGLGRQSRFGGQTREFYTVLCHSLVCHNIAHELWPEDQGARRVLLMHDGHESIIGDTPTPWKNPMTEDDEDDLDARIWTEFDLPEVTDRVKLVDLAARAAEAHVLGHARAERFWPRSEFGDVERLAERLTQIQLSAGNPVRYLNPHDAIQAMKRAYDR